MRESWRYSVTGPSWRSCHNCIIPKVKQAWLKLQTNSFLAQSMEQKLNLCYYGIYIIMGLCECGSLKNYESKKKIKQNNSFQNILDLRLLWSTHACYIYATYMTSVYTMMSLKPCCWTHNMQGVNCKFPWAMQCY